MFQWFIRFAEFTEFLFHLGKTLLLLEKEFNWFQILPHVPYMTSKYFFIVPIAQHFDPLQVNYIVQFWVRLANGLFEQECIPVGCVPTDRRLYAGVCFQGGGFSMPGGSPCLGEFSMPGGVWSQGDSPCQGVWSWGDSPCWGFSMPGWVLHARGVLHAKGVLHAWGGSPCQTTPWTEWQTSVKILPWPKLRFGW